MTRTFRMAPRAIACNAGFVDLTKRPGTRQLPREPLDDNGTAPAHCTITFRPRAN